MGLGTMFADLNAINQTYNFGFAATNDLISAIVHEYGHAVSSFLKAEPKERGSFNNFPFLESKNLQNKKRLNSNYLNNITAQSILECDDLLVDYLNEKASIGQNPIKIIFFPLIVIRSNYGRSYWSQDNDNYWRKKNEFFAEAFDEWIDTPVNKRTWNWELLN